MWWYLEPYSEGFPGDPISKESTYSAGDPGSISASGRYPGEESGNPSIILAWEIPWTVEPGGLQSMDLFITTFSSVQSLSRVWLLATPWIAARQASLSITNSQSSLKLMSIESVMPSSHLILCCPFSSCPQSFLASESFPMSQLFAWGGQSTGVSALASVLDTYSFLTVNCVGIHSLC